MAAPGRLQRPHLSRVDRELAALRVERDGDRPRHGDPRRVWPGAWELPRSQAHAAMTLVVMIMPAAALVLPIFLELNALHLIGNALSVILPFSFFPFGVYLAYIYYSTAIPRDLLDAARLDGCGEWPTFRHIALPLAMPIVALVLFFSFVSDWNNFFLPYAVLADSSQYPIQVGLSNLLSSTPSFNPAVGGGGQSVDIFRPELALATLLAVSPWRSCSCSRSARSCAGSSARGEGVDGAEHTDALRGCSAAGPRRRSRGRLCGSRATRCWGKYAVGRVRVLGVVRAERLRERAFLDSDARQRSGKADEQRSAGTCPAAEAEPETAKDEKDAGVGGVAEHAIWATTDNPLARLDRHHAAEVASQAHDRPVTKRGPCKDDGDSRSERPPVVGVVTETRHPRDHKRRGDAEVAPRSATLSIVPRSRMMAAPGHARTTAVRPGGGFANDAGGRGRGPDRWRRAHQLPPRQRPRRPASARADRARATGARPLPVYGATSPLLRPFRDVREPLKRQVTFENYGGCGVWAGNGPSQASAPTTSSTRRPTPRSYMLKAVPGLTIEICTSMDGRRLERFLRAWVAVVLALQPRSASAAVRAPSWPRPASAGPCAAPVRSSAFDGQLRPQKDGRAKSRPPRIRSATKRRKGSRALSILTLPGRRREARERAPALAQPRRAPVGGGTRGQRRGAMRSTCPVSSRTQTAPSPTVRSTGIPLTGKMPMIWRVRGSMRKIDLASRSDTQSEPKARPMLIGDTLPLTRRPVGLFVRGSICLMTLPQ